MIAASKRIAFYIFPWKRVRATNIWNLHPWVSVLRGEEREEECTATRIESETPSMLNFDQNILENNTYVYHTYRTHCETSRQYQRMRNDMIWGELKSNEIEIHKETLSFHINTCLREYEEIYGTSINRIDREFTYRRFVWHLRWVESK